MPQDQLTVLDAIQREPLEPIGLPIASKDRTRITAATYLGVSRATIYRLLAAGELEGFHARAAAMVTRASLDAYVTRQRAAEGERLRA